MPGGRATKPGDVLTGAGGKTVEVLNTDAEGRLILGDGLWYAQRLGRDASRRRRDAHRRVRRRARQSRLGTLRAARDVGRERSARRRRAPAIAPGRCHSTTSTPNSCSSEIADLVNTGGRPAGACTAAIFLKEFAGGLPWAHLDIAGTAWADEAKPWQPKGPTGVGGPHARGTGVHERRLEVAEHATP